MLLFYLEWLFVIMALYWSLLKVIKNDIISIERCWYIVDHLVYSPRVWRSSYASSINAPKLIVFSTYVEVIPSLSVYITLPSCILHVCGGHPTIKKYQILWWEYSPRMWRSSFFAWLSSCKVLVFSTYVEVILRVGLFPTLFFSILHVCGGHPFIGKALFNSILYSPRMWRSSSRSIKRLR